jgi:hypothetical protein
MRRTVFELCAAAVLVFAATGAQAQTTCPGSVAQITTPAAGSVLPAGAVTFAWCNASADYFLTIETVRGAANIFNAFVVGVESVTLGPACNVPSPANPTTECIPTSGETIFLTLWTNTAQTGRKNFIAAPTITFTAPNSNPAPVPALTTTSVASPVSVAFSASDQSVALAATVAAGAAVNQGNVTFRVLDGATAVGAAVTSATLASGSASATYLLPGGTAAKAYTIQASFSGGPNFLASSGSGSLVVAPSPAGAAPTTTSVAPQAVGFSAAAQSVTLTASVAAAAAVNEGTITFSVLDAASAIVGTAVTSSTLANGGASAAFLLPAGLPAGAYTIQADYSDGAGTNFLASTGSGTLTVNPPAPAAQAPTVTAVQDNVVLFDSNGQNVTLSAAVAVAGGTVTEGTVTFRVADASSNPVGAAVVSAGLAGGSASALFALPPGLAAGRYAIEATYSGGPSFLASSGIGTLTIAAAPSAPATVGDLVAQVTGLNLGRETGKELLSKLQDAQAELDRGRPRAAISKLRDFIEEVQESVREGRLDASIAASLSAEAASLISQLGS